MTTNSYSRRRLLQTAGTVTLVGVTGGCSSGDGSDSDGEGTDTDTSDGTDDPDGGEGYDTLEAPDDVATWLENDDTFEGAMADFTSRDVAEVVNGAKGNGGSNAFDPSAISISGGTTVRWLWAEGTHNVAAENDDFYSGGPESDATFEYTFEEAGTWLYYCEPHRGLGDKGAILVE